MKRAVIAVLIFLCAAPAYCWGPIGHMMVAAVAWHQMKASTRREIARIFIFGDEISGNFGGQFDHIDYVKVNPDTATDAEIETQVGPAFIQAATWPDDIKGSVVHVPHQTVPNPDFQNLVVSLNSALDKSLVASSESMQLKSWHFVDMPLVIKSRKVVADMSGKHPFDLPQPDKASEADNALRVEIEPHLAKLAPGATSDPNDTAIYVYLLEHIVGDLHQPLHCAALYNKKFSQTVGSIDPQANDHGGNLYKVSQSKSLLNGMNVALQSNLHSLWDHGGDNAILTDSSLGITDVRSLKPADLMPIAASWVASSAPSDPNQSSDITPIDWVKESNQLAISDAYKGIKQKAKVTEAYAKNYVDVCRHQIVLGGMRLANILDQALN